MTCVAARVYANRISMAADSCLTDDSGQVMTGQAKLWKVNPFLLLGFAGDWGCVSKIRYTLVSSMQAKNFYPSSRDLDRWVYMNIVERARQLLDSFKKPEFSMLIATPQGLYGTDSTYGVWKHPTYAGIGSGGLGAECAMFVGATPRKAVEAAIRHAEGVQAPIHQESIECQQKSF